MAQAKPKSNSVLTSVWTGNVLTLTVIGIEKPIVFDADGTSVANQQQAMRHGYTQKLSDAAALGMLASKQDKYDAIEDLAEYLMSGEVPWKRAGGGGTGTSMLLRALLEAYSDKTEAQWREILTKATAKQKSALANSDKIEPIIARFRKEAAKSVSADDVLAQMLNEGAGASEMGEDEVQVA